MKVGICLAAVVVLSGCQLLPEYQNSCMPCAPSAIADGGDASANPISTGGNYLPSVTDYPPRPTKPLSDYAADLAFQLLQSMQYVLPEQPVAIPTFVEFDQQLSNTTAVGNQLAEHMYYQMQRLGIPVADIKLSSQIRVTPAGDLVFSRDSYLDTKQRVNYVLAGTILRDSAGLVVNARVMHMRTKTVIGSAQLHIPDFVLTASANVSLSAGSAGY